MALSDYGKICWAAWYPFNNHSFIKAHTSLPSKCLPPFESSVQYILHSIKPRKMSRYQCVCAIILIGAFSLCVCFFVCAVSVFLCVCSAQSVPVGAISYLVTLYESNVSQRQRRGIRFVHCMTPMPLHIPPPPPGCKTPTDGKSASAQDASTGHINAGWHTPSHTQREKLEAHSDTPRGKEERERGYCYGWDRHGEADSWVRVCGAVMADIWL